MLMLCYDHYDGNSNNENNSFNNENHNGHMNSIKKTVFIHGYTWIT